MFNRISYVIYDTAKRKTISIREDQQEWIQEDLPSFVQEKLDELIEQRER